MTKLGQRLIRAADEALAIARDNSKKKRKPSRSRKARASAWIDPDEAPELTKEYFERADLYHGDMLIRRGRPPSDNPKHALKLRIDADVVEHFRAHGRGLPPHWHTLYRGCL